MLRAKKPKPKLKQVMVRFTADQYARIQAAALDIGVELAVYCRLAVMSAATQQTGAVENRLRGNTVKSQPPSRSSDGGGEWSPKKSRSVARRARGRTSANTMAGALAAVRSRRAA